MRRLLLPALLLIIVIAASIQMNNANEAADPGVATAVSDEASLATPMFSARRAPGWLRAPTSDLLLTDSIGTVLATGDRPEQACVLVTRGDERLAASSTETAIRAAELHRFITATLIDSAGSGQGFRTEIAYSTSAELVPVDEELGTFELVGDIWIIGSGDPGLASWDYISRFRDGRAYTSWDTLTSDAIEALQAANIVSIDGRIIGDETKYSPNERDYFDDELTIDDTTVKIWSGPDDGSVGPMSALLLNDGFVSWPAELDQTANTRSANPAVSAADIFDDLLEAAGFTVRRSPADGEAPPLAERVTIATIDSPPLIDIIERSLIDATTAEMLLKEYGIRLGGGPERAGIILGLVRDGFELSGLPFDILSNSTIYADGSGRSSLNRTSCEMIHATIDDPSGIGAAILRKPTTSNVAHCARAGAGTLRVFATADGDATGIAGTYVAENGERLTFVMLAEDPGRLTVPEGAPDDTEPVGPFEFCNPLQVALLDAITGHPYGPALQELSPLTPVGD
ncbi:MAG: D-alanyl-D-alanine carboxypeptidase [Acidimicrobiales bacterium]